MELKITEVIDKGDRYVLRMEYDEEFAQAVADIFKLKTVTDEQVESFITMIIENLDSEELGELRDEIDE